MKKVKINGEFEIVLPIHRANRPEWYSEKGWEKKRLSSMHKFIKEGDIVIYVGSEEGEMPALCQMWGADVVMIEPNYRVWSNTKAIWDANKLASPLGCFVGFASPKTTDGVNIIMNGFPLCADGEIISDHGFKELSDPGSIPQVKIDDIAGLIITQKKVPTVISMDVEGSEWEVLKGATETLKKLKPMLFISWHPEFMFRIYNQYVAEARKWLTDLGYKEEFIDYPLHEVHFRYFYE